MTDLKTFIAALASVLASASTAASESRKNCAPRPAILETLGKTYNETRQSIGLGGNNQVVEVFAGETGSWTIIMTLPSGLSCVIASGRAFENLVEDLPPEGEPA